jgi:hypothetical protein
MRFAVLSLVTVAALTMSAGSVHAQRMHGGFASPGMMNPGMMNPGMMNSGMMHGSMNFNTSPFMHHSTFARPQFGTASFAHPHHSNFNHTVLFPNRSLALSTQRTVSLFSSTSPFGRTAVSSSVTVSPTSGGFIVPSVQQSSFVVPRPSSNFFFFSRAGTPMTPWWW